MAEFVGGKCLVSDEVINTVIAMAAARVEGITYVRGLDARTSALRRHYYKSIHTAIEGRTLITDLTVGVDRESVILEVVAKVQEQVKEDVETMLGLHCERVDVTVE